MILDFLQVIQRLDRTSKNNDKITLLVDLFLKQSGISGDASLTAITDEGWNNLQWILWFFLGKKLKSKVRISLLKSICISATRTPDWLFQECYADTGDLGETIAHLTHSLRITNTSCNESPSLLHEWITSLESNLAKSLSQSRIHEFFIDFWQRHSFWERWFLHKLLAGSLRLGLNEAQIALAFSRCFGLERDLITHVLKFKLDPYKRTLSAADFQVADRIFPVPFQLCHSLDEAGIDDLVYPLMVERKWDGIRAQIILATDEKDAPGVWIWSRGGEPLNEAFPDLVEEILPHFENLLQTQVVNTSDRIVLDGEILAGSVELERGLSFSFQKLQTRIRRKKPSKKILQDHPAYFAIFDCLAMGRDLRCERLEERQKILVKNLPPATRFFLTDAVYVNHRHELEQIYQTSKSLGWEGCMIKDPNSVYQGKRVQKDWWKWKQNPMTLDMLLIYAQPGHGRRSGLYSDYTFGVLAEGDQILPLTKAYSGLDDSELKDLDAWVRKNTLKKFGPVRQVKADRVFEIAFENIASSSRHKAGFALRFPRILRSRPDKQAHEANTLDDLKKLYDQK